MAQVGCKKCERLQSIVERVELLEEKKATLITYIREVYLEAKMPA